MFCNTRSDLKNTFCLLLAMEECNTDAGVTDTSSFYQNGKKYWESISPTVDGMLGGLSHLSSVDIAESTRFLKQFLCVSVPLLIIIINVQLSSIILPVLTSLIFLLVVTVVKNQHQSCLRLWSRYWESHQEALVAVFQDRRHGRTESKFS